MNNKKEILIKVPKGQTWIMEEPVEIIDRNLLRHDQAMKTLKEMRFI